MPIRSARDQSWHPGQVLIDVVVSGRRRRHCSVPSASRPVYQGMPIKSICRRRAYRRYRA